MAEYVYNRNCNGEEWQVGIGEINPLLTKISNQLGRTDVTIRCSGDELKVIFDGDLTAGQETELESIVNNYLGDGLKHFRLYCGSCGDYKSVRMNETPMECPACSGVNISDVVEHTPYSAVKDELGNEWEKFMLSTGVILSARRH